MSLGRISQEASPLSRREVLMEWRAADNRHKSDTIELK